MTSYADPAELIAETWRVIDGERRLDQMDRFFADEYVRHSSEGDYDREGFRRVLEALYQGFPDSAFRLEDTVAQGDRIAYRWSSVGTHLGDYMGVPATNKRVTAAGITISRIGDDGRTAEDWASWNKVSVLHALGIIPIG